LSPEALARLFPRLAQADTQQYVAAANAEYRHWEKLRHLPPPEGLTPEEAWQAVKLSRLGQKRLLPLQDTHNRPFTYWLPNSALETLHEVDRWGGTSLALPEGTGPTLGAMRDRIIISSLMEEAIATSQIEGAVITRKAAKEMLRTNRRPRNRSEQMILNSYRTIRLLQERLDEALSLDLLFEIQQSMTRDTLDDPSGAGRLRTASDSVVIVDVRDNEVVFVPPAADLLPGRLGRLIEFANASSVKESFIHPLTKAAILHFWLAYEHPFIDGNGRTARALLYWLMLKSGYWLFEFLTISRVIVAAPAQYYRSFLCSEHDDNDLTYSLTYQLGATQRALANLREYLARKQAETQQLSAALRRFPGLNHRQRALIEHALRHSAYVYTFQSHQRSHNITYPTARTDLLDLLRRGLLTEMRQGRQRGFIAEERLAEKLDTVGKRPKRGPAT